MTRLHDAELVEVVRLPYGDEGRFAMEVFQPPPDEDLGTCLDGFDVQQWADATAALQPTTDLFLSLPRFELTGTSTLDAGLQELGLVDAFGPGADFGAMGPVGWLHTVVQKTFIRVVRVHHQRPADRRDPVPGHGRGPARLTAQRHPQTVAGP